MTYDEGGWLPAGPTLVVNDSGEPEHVHRIDCDLDEDCSCDDADD